MCVPARITWAAYCSNCLGLVSKCADAAAADIAHVRPQRLHSVCDGAVSQLRRMTVVRPAALPKVLGEFGRAIVSCLS